MQSENCRIYSKSPAARSSCEMLIISLLWLVTGAAYSWAGDRGTGARSHRIWALIIIIMIIYLAHESNNTPANHINHPSPKINLKINDTKASPVKRIKQTQRQKPALCSCLLYLFVGDLDLWAARMKNLMWIEQNSAHWTERCQSQLLAPSILYPRLLTNNMFVKNISN